MCWEVDADQISNTKSVLSPQRVPCQPYVSLHTYPLHMAHAQIHFFDHAWPDTNASMFEQPVQAADLDPVDPNPYLLKMPMHTRGKVGLQLARCSKLTGFLDYVCCCRLRAATTMVLQDTFAA